MIPEFLKPITANSSHLVSEHGKVWSKEQGRFLNQSTNRGGYLVVGINGRTAYPHRLVAERWVPNPNKFRYVRHKDGNQYNNHYSNLEWYKYTLENHGLSKKEESRKEMVLRIAREYMT